jgi:hypothetical protein
MRYQTSQSIHGGEFLSVIVLTETILLLNIAVVFLNVEHDRLESSSRSLFRARVASMTASTWAADTNSFVWVWVWVGGGGGGGVVNGQYM